ncbi:S8 family peptidase [Kordia sp.]|uniref:S8 family peptidase n=1 Tax=Kordia sp. TaxID=1965332 RepID=UPI003D6A3178
MNFIIESKDPKDLDILRERISKIKSRYTFSHFSLLDKFKNEGINELDAFNSEEFERISNRFSFLEIQGATRIGETIKNVLNIEGLDFVKEVNVNFADTKETFIDFRAINNSTYRQLIFDMIGFSHQFFSGVLENQNQIIAVADTGVDHTNEKLKPNLWFDPTVNSHGFNLTTANGNDFFNVYDDTSTNNKRGHGTAVSSIIGKNTLSSEGVGILPSSFKILNLKVFPGHKSSFTQTCLALVFAGLMGASVVNCSWGIPKIQNQPKLVQLLDRVLLFLKEKNCIPVFAAMNDRKKVSNIFPQNSEHVITVGSVTHDLERAEDSNWGNEIDIWAPGENIHVMKARKLDATKYTLESGTSMAAPFVSSAIALLKSKNSSLAIDDIKKILTESGTLIEIDKSAHKVRLLNIQEALAYLQNNY